MIDVLTHFSNIFNDSHFSLILLNAYFVDLKSKNKVFLFRFDLISHEKVSKLLFSSLNI